ncbi:transmembrane protein, putative, partial [Rhizoctonia solani AG-3 Rhs1AP]
MFQLSKKLFVLTLVCLTIVFYSSLYPSIEPLGRLPEQRRQGYAVTCGNGFYPFGIGIGIDIGTIGQCNPALPTPGHVSKALGTGRVQVEEPVYIQPLLRDDAPDARFGSQYFEFGSFCHIKNSPWFVPGLFAMLVGAIAVLEALAQLETLRPTLKPQSCAPARATLNHQVASPNTPGSNKVSLRVIESDHVVVLGIQLVASLALTTSNQEVFMCTSSNFIVCGASNIDLWLDVIITRDVPILEELCANLGAVDIIYSSIQTTAYTMEASVLDTWGIDGTQDRLYSHWFIQTHAQATRTPHPYADSRSQVPGQVDPRTPTYAPSRSVHMYSSWAAQNSIPSLSLMCNCRPRRNQITGREWNTVVRPSINWYILGLIARNFSTSLRLSATSVTPSVEQGGSFVDSSHIPFERLGCVSRFELDHHLVTLLVKVIVVPDSTFTLLLFGRRMPTKCTDSSPLCRGLMIEWVPQAVNPRAEVTITSDFNPIVVEHRARQAIRPGRHQVLSANLNTPELASEYWSMLNRMRE